MIAFSIVAMLVATVLGIAVAINSPTKFMLFLLPISIFQFGADLEGAGGLANISAIWLLLIIGVCILAMLRVGSGGLRLNVPEIVYLLFLAWCAFEFARAEDHAYAARAFLRLIFPFMSMYLARRTVTSAALAERLIKYQYLSTLAGTTLAWGIYFATFIFVYFTTFLWFGAVFLDQAAIVVFLAMAHWKVRHDIRSLVFSAALVGICFVAVNRTSLLGLVVGGSVFCLLEYRKLSVIMLPALYMSLGAVVILVPSFRAKMFYQPDKAGREVVLTTDVLSNQQFNNDGRFSMWTEVLNRFYWPNPVMGSGLGATQAWFYGGGAEQVLHSKIKVEHSEYVKLAADTGTVGLGLYMAMHLCAFAMAIGAYRRSRGGMARIFSVAAACALPVFWVCMAFDNSLLYVLPVAQFPTALAAIAWRLSTISTSDRVENLPSTRPGAPLLARRRVGQRFADVAGNRAKNLSPAAHV